METDREEAKGTRLRIVIDTSVLVAALLSPKGYAFEVINLLAEGKVTFFLLKASPFRAGMQ